VKAMAVWPDGKPKLSRLVWSFSLLDVLCRADDGQRRLSGNSNVNRLMQDGVFRLESQVLSGVTRLSE
jgi:hypothetical protein